MANDIPLRRKVSAIEAQYGQPIDRILWDLYHARQMTQQQIAAELHLDRTTIIRLMRRHGVPARRPVWVYQPADAGTKPKLSGLGATERSRWPS